MSEELKEKKAEEYQFIKEEIIPKKKSKWRKRIETLGFVACAAVVFGVVSGVVFVTSGALFKEWFGIEEGQRQQIDLPRPTEGTVRPNPTLTNKPAEPTKRPDDTQQSEATPGPTKEGVVSPTAAPTTIPVTPEPTKTEEPLPTGEPGMEETGETEGSNPEGNNQERTDAEDDAAKQFKETYGKLYAGIAAVAGEVQPALVTIEAIEQGIDWFQETYETRTKATGMILANDGIDLLILADTQRISGASSIEVYLDEEVVDGRIYSLDKNYGLAVIAVPLAHISEETFAKLALAKLADEAELTIGMPVIALGAPNGYEGSMEFGMVTSLGSTVPVTDGEVPYFTTDITEHTSGYGFVLNLSGEFVGMMTHTHKENTEDGIFSAISLDAIRGVIEKLLNHEKQAYFGIKGQDIPRKLVEKDVMEQGVYVSEVLNSSPALAAGIKAGDVIISIGNTEVSGIRQFTEFLLGCSTREIVQVKLMRKFDGELREMTVEVVLTEKN